MVPRLACPISPGGPPSKASTLMGIWASICPETSVRCGHLRPQSTKSCWEPRKAGFWWTAASWLPHLHCGHCLAILWSDTGREKQWSLSSCYEHHIKGWTSILQPCQLPPKLELHSHSMQKPRCHMAFWARVSHSVLLESCLSDLYLLCLQLALTSCYCPPLKTTKPIQTNK